MKQVDSLYKNPPVQKENFWVPETPIVPVVEKKPFLKLITPSNNFYYFYKSLQVVVTVWIVTLVFMMVTPWADYFVKSKIKEKTTVLGTQSVSQTSNPIADSSLIPTPTPSSTTSFYLKNAKVEIQAPIVEGIMEDSLKQGIGHHPDSVWPNQVGNVVIAGHNVDLDTENQFGKVFLKLRDVAIGDEVVVSYQKKKYHYKIFNRQTVSPEDTSLFGPVDGWVLTFYTCDPPYTDWKRLVFQAKLTRIE